MTENQIPANDLAPTEMGRYLNWQRQAFLKHVSKVLESAWSTVKRLNLHLPDFLQGFGLLWGTNYCSKKDVRTIW